MTDAPPPGDRNSGSDSEPLVVDLGSAAARGSGVIWSLPHGGDLDANLVWLSADDTIADHGNDDVDIVMFVQSGTGRLTVDQVERDLGADHIALIPRGARRSIRAGSGGLTYLSIHRRRGPLTIGPRPQPSP